MDPMASPCVVSNAQGMALGWSKRSAGKSSKLWVLERMGSMFKLLFDY